MAATYAGKLKVAKVNVDENGATPSRYGIRGIPALLFFKGGKVADQIVGFVPQEVIEEKVKRLLAYRGLADRNADWKEIALSADAPGLCLQYSPLAHRYLRSTPSTRP